MTASALSIFLFRPSSENSGPAQDVDPIFVSLKNGTFTLKARLGTMVDCTATFFPAQKSYLRGIADVPASTTNKCIARVFLYAAPETQYASMIRTWEASGMGATELLEWAQAWVQRNQRQTANSIAQMSRQAEQTREAIREQYQHNMEVSQEMHRQFMESMQAGTDASMNRTGLAMRARATTTSDIVDYALDRRTTVNQVTGELGKTPNQANVVWGNNQGDIFTSKNPLADPRGVLPGDWSSSSSPTATECRSSGRTSFDHSTVDGFDSQVNTSSGTPASTHPRLDRHFPHPRQQPRSCSPESHARRCSSSSHQYSARRVLRCVKPDTPTTALDSITASFHLALSTIQLLNLIDRNDSDRSRLDCHRELAVLKPYGCRLWHDGVCGFE